MFVSEPCMPCVPQTPSKRVAFGSILGTCFAAHVSEEDGLHEWCPVAISGRFHMRSFWAVACGLVAVAWKSHKWQAAFFALVWRALLLKQKQLFLPLLAVPGLLRKTSPVPIAMKFPLPTKSHRSFDPFSLLGDIFGKDKALWQCGEKQHFDIWYVIYILQFTYICIYLMHA